MTETECPLCGDSFTSETGVRDHDWDVHSACHYCSTTFDDRESLYPHWLDDHEGELTTEDHKRAETTVGDRTVCPVCDQRFARDTAVRDHTWDAHGACYLCGAEFDTQDALFTHQLAIHDDLSRETRDRAKAAVAPLTFGNRLAHEGPVGALTNASVSRRKERAPARPRPVPRSPRSTARRSSWPTTAARR